MKLVPTTLGPSALLYSQNTNPGNLVTEKIIRVIRG